MADRFYAKITIGGPIPESVKQELVQEIEDWRPWEDIRVEDNYDNGEVLVLEACEVGDGVFYGLETLLQAHRIPYDRYSGDYNGYAPYKTHYRPGLEIMEYSLTSEGHKFFEQDVIEGLINSMPAQQAVDIIRGMLTEEPALPGMATEMADYLADIAENGLPEEKANVQA